SGPGRCSPPSSRRRDIRCTSLLPPTAAPRARGKLGRPSTSFAGRAGCAPP
ncbi:hypothetical protein OHPBIL_OHPBIL_03675, partial [Dysosmobacter welbionis]